MSRIKTILAGALMITGMVYSPEALAFGKGEKSVGVSGGYATYNNSGYVTVNFQWEFANHFRLAPDLGCVFPARDKSGFLVDCDLHFPFKLVRGFGVYPLIGLAYNNWHISHPGNVDSENLSRVGGNVGLGFDFYFTRNLKMQVQGKYSWMRDTDGGFIGLGLSYIF